MKYKAQVTTIPNGHKELSHVSVISKHRTADKAIMKMRAEAADKIGDLLNQGCDVQCHLTSDERYPDAWGWANNGVFIKDGNGGTIYQYEVVEE